METSVSPPTYWWMKGRTQEGDFEDIPTLDIISKGSSSSIIKERDLNELCDSESDIGSIIEEINKLAAKSPLGPYEKDTNGRSVEDIMKEAEQIFIESSKSFEQLSARSKTSANLSNSFIDRHNSTPSLKGASPLPFDEDNREEYYSDDFTEGEASSKLVKNTVDSDRFQLKLPDAELIMPDVSVSKSLAINSEIIIAEKLPTDEKCKETAKYLERIEELKVQLKETTFSPRITLNTNNSNSISADTELEKALEELKDAKETNNALQLQLNDLSQSYLLLKISHDESLESNNKLNAYISECESTLEKYKTNLESNQEQLNKLLETETSLSKLLDFEKLQLRSAKLQNEKDARCILDLNRQVKEMERIIARKHPDSVSALIVAAKNDDVDNNLTTKRFLEERVKSLENEVVIREQQSSKIFLEVQEKFTEMKNKYESHIEDLELHVNDLKQQIMRKTDTFEIYTQTLFVDQEIPAKETKTTGSQTTYIVQRPTNNQHAKRTEKNDKEDAHLLATIRGLQADLVNKEKTITKVQKELEETKKTIRRLQKEREGSLKNVSERKEFRSYPEKLVSAAQCNCKHVDDLEDELRLLKADRDKIKTQLCKMEEDYQQLKSKRLFDLSALQQAHENEISTYISNITPLQKQLEIQQSTINLLEQQVKLTKLRALEESNSTFKRNENIQGSYQVHNENSMTNLNSMAQKKVPCSQCTLRQQQLIMYKTELDQLLETVQALT